MVNIQDCSKSVDSCGLFVFNLQFPPILKGHHDWSCTLGGNLGLAEVIKLTAEFSFASFLKEHRRHNCNSPSEDEPLHCTVIPLFFWEAQRIFVLAVPSRPHISSLS